VLIGLLAGDFIMLVLIYFSSHDLFYCLDDSGMDFMLLALLTIMLLIRFGNETLGFLFSFTILLMAWIFV